MSAHVPVLLQEVRDGVALRAGDSAIDCTFGGGGYTKAMLAANAPDGRVLALDCDPEVVARAANGAFTADEHRRCTIVHANFAHVAAVAAQQRFDMVRAIVADLGLSSDQLAGAHRGFSFVADGPLDMRCDPTSGKPTAAELLATLPGPALERVFREYGEELRARAIADAIVATRRRTPMVTTQELAACIASVAPRRGRLHPATRVFQALRIAVNDELGNLAAAIPQMLALLVPGGRVAIVSFHSLEDRIVKRAFRTAASTHEFALVTRRPRTPSATEVTHNPRSRSAKLRIIERTM